MISGIGGSSSFYSSLFAPNGASGTNSTSSLAQTEERLFTTIDGNGDGAISRSEFTSFLNKTAGAAGSGSGPSGAASASGMGSANGSAAMSDLLSQLTRSAQSLVAGSAAGIANASNHATNTSRTGAGSSQSHHHGHGSGGPLISQFMQQYQAAGATSVTATPTISASV